LPITEDKKHPIGANPHLKRLDGCSGPGTQFALWRLSMKALFVVGLAVMILGILSFFVAIPHSENHGIKAGDVDIGIQTHESEKVAPAISAVMLVVGAGLMIAGRSKT
jgi:hypothetical protein